MLQADTGVRKGKQVEALAHPWMPLAFLILLFALFGYLLLIFSKRGQMAVPLKVKRQTCSSLL